MMHYSCITTDIKQQLLFSFTVYLGSYDSILSMSIAIVKQKHSWR